MHNYYRSLFGVILVLTVTIAILIGIALIFPERMLIEDSGDVKADLLIVLGGAQQGRAERAAELYRHGDAPEILVSGFGDNETNIQVLERNGVPSSAIIQENHSISTYENAKFSIPILHKLHVQSAIIVTSWYHSRRATACFNHFAPDIKFYSRPSYFGCPSRGSMKQDLSGYVRIEYAKLLFYWIWHGVTP